MHFRSIPKSLLVTPCFPPQEGGAENYLYSICTTLPPESIVVATPTHEHSWHFDTRQAFKIQRTHSVPHLGNALLSLKACSLFLNGDFRAIQFGTVGLAGLMKLMPEFFHRRPYIVYTYGKDVTKLRPSKLRDRLLIAALRGACRVVTISQFTKGKLVELGVNPDRIALIHPAVSARFLSPPPDAMAVRERLNLIGKKVILTVGHLIERKGHDTVIKALPWILERVPEVRYVIAGRGVYEKTLRRLVGELGLESYVLFLGYADDAELPLLYSACDVFVMISRQLGQDDVEGFGIVYIEANACSKPVIGGRVGGALDAILDGQTGLLVEPTDVEAVAEAITSLLSDESKAQQMGILGRQIVDEHFCPARISSQVKRMLVEVAG